MKKVIIIIALVIILSFNTKAKYTQTCVVNYISQGMWSKDYTVDVTFISGTELNDSIKSSKYSSNSVYAIIFLGEGQYSVINLSTFLPCGDVADKNCVTIVGSYLKGKDQDDDYWRICANDICLKTTQFKKTTISQ